MAEVFQIGNETIRKEELDNISKEILDILKKERRTYQFNKSILRYCIERLDQDMKSTIFH